jgi:hypothetical protein
MTQFCNAYGAENPGGHPVAFGGFLPNPVTMAHVCRERPQFRGRWVCACGHRGSVVELCNQHWGEFTGQKAVRGPAGRMQSVPWNVRRDIQACPRCASLADRPEQQHKCAVRLEAIS